jgi:glycosyltransferase involved in cell wall biosynthesis
MRFAVSLLNLRPGEIGGAETYVRRLVAELPAERRPGESLVLVMDRDLAERLPAPGWERAVAPRSARAVVVERVLEAFTPYRARAMERLFLDLKADAVLFPQQSIFPKRAPVPAVLTAVDVLHLHHPDQIALFDRLYRPAIYPYSMARAEQVLAISEFTRRTVIEACALPPDRVTAIPLGFDARGGEPAAPTTLVEGPYLYYPAATFRHKDHATLLESYAALRRAGRLAERLVFTGLRTREWPRLERLAASLGIAGEVRHLGFVPAAEVRRVDAGATAVLFPSRYEGFGLPVVEAAVEFGKKVITSRLEVFDEIGVPADRQIDFADPEALAAALALEGPTVLTRRPLSWAECAGRTLQVLREVAARAASPSGASRLAPA